MNTKLRFRQAIRTHVDTGLMLAVVLGTFAYLPFLVDPGLVNTRAGGDSPFLLVRLHQMTVALRDGVFPVRWMPDAAYGLGYPFFNFYAPLPYYLASGLYFLGLGFVGALKVTQAIGFVVASVAMYQLACELWNSRPAGLLASLAYTYAPFHLANIYVRGDSLGEFWAFAFYPLIFLSLRRSRTHPTLSRAAGLALSYAGLILSHNISALIFTPFVLLYAATAAGEQGGRRDAGTRRQEDTETGANRTASPCLRVTASPSLSLTLSGLLLGLALSAWYWAPALAERGAVQLEQNLTGYFFYGEHFRAKNLVQTAVLFNYTISRNNTPFALGLAQAIGIGLGLLAIGAHWLRRRRTAPEVAAIVVILFLALVLITPLSRPVWDHVPLLAFAQFPWRILSVVAFAGSLITGAIIKTQISNPKSQISNLGFGIWDLKFDIWNLIFGICSLVIGIWSAASVMLPLQVDYLPVTDADVSPERLAVYELFTGNIGSTVRAEYLPLEVNPRPLTSPFLLAPEHTAKPVVLAGQLANAERVERRSAAQRWRVEVVSTEARLAFPLFAFPGWVARIDGQPAPSQAVTGLGYLATAVPQGEHTVDLVLTRTPVRLASEILSLVAWLLLLGALAWGKRFSGNFRGDLVGVPNLLGVSGVPPQQVGDSGTPTSSIQFVSHPVLFIVAIMISAGLTMSNSPPADVSSAMSQTDTMDFQVMPYLHPNPDGISYGERIRLLNYTLSGDPDSPPSGWPRASAGQALTATLAWEGPPPAGWRTEIALVSPALPLLNAPVVADRSEVPLARVTHHTLNIPIETTPGLYLLRLEVTGTDHREVSPHTRRGSGLDTTYLAPVWIIAPATSQPPGPPLARFQRGILLERGQFLQLSPQAARVDLVWRAESVPTTNYLTSIRLLAADGKILAAVDQPPLYGFAPTATWTPHAPIYDQRWLKLPAGLTTGDNYRVQVVLYVAGTLQELGTAEIPGAIK